MFNKILSKTIFLALPLAAAVMLTGCEEEIAAVENTTGEAVAPAADTNSDTVDLAQTEDLFSQPIQANPLTSDPNAVIVKVNGEEITRGEVLQVVGMALQRMGGQVPPQQMQQIQAQLFEQFKNDLINKKLLNATVAAANVVVSDEDVSAELDNLRGQVPEGQDLEAALTAQGTTLEALMENLKKDLATRTFLEGKVKDIADASEEEAKEFYDSNPDNFKKPENVSASHILAKFAEGETDEGKTEKKASIEKVRSDILSGIVTFEDAAKTHSGCPSSAQGGSLGTFGKGQMVPEFEVAAFSQEIDEVGDVVETQFGYHIIKVTAHQDEGVVTFEESKERILTHLTGQKKQQAVVDFVKTLRDSATIEEIAL